jgi:hypothetical protein
MRVAQLTLAVSLFATALFAADNRFLGTWKVNIAKSQFSPGPVPKELTVTFADDGEKIKRALEGIDAEGKPFKQEGSIKWDGQDHPMPNGDGTMTIAWKMVNDNTVQFTRKSEGKVTTTGHAVLSKDAKTVTITETSVNSKGEKVHSVVVLERQ